MRNRVGPTWETFGTQKKNSLQPNAQPSGTQPTLARRDALAVCPPCGAGVKRRTVRGDVPKVTKTCKKKNNASANCSQTGNQKWYPKLEPKVVPKIGTTTRTLVHCYLKTNYAREEHQNMSPKWEPFSVPKTGTHYNPMRNQVRPKREPFLVPRRRTHYNQRAAE